MNVAHQLILISNHVLSDLFLSMILNGKNISSSYKNRTSIKKYTLYNYLSCFFWNEAYLNCLIILILVLFIKTNRFGHNVFVLMVVTPIIITGSCHIHILHPYSGSVYICTAGTVIPVDTSRN